MKKQLIFYWYIPKNGIYSTSYDVHLYCLDKYKKIFDNQLFILSIDEQNDIYINDAKSKIKKIFPNAEFQLMKNNPNIRESILVYTILNSLDKFKDANIFFGHSKGTTNNQVGDLYKWIYSLYYFNLNDINKVDNILNDNINKFISFGTLKKIFDFKSFEIFSSLPYEINKYCWHYSGTFYWFSVNKLLKHLQDYNIEVDKHVHRWYAECVLGNLYHSKYAYTEGYDIPEYDLYNKCDYVLKTFMLDELDYNKFSDSFNEMKNTLNL